MRTCLLGLFLVAAVCADETPAPTAAPTAAPTSVSTQAPTTALPSAPPTALEVALVGPTSILLRWTWKGDGSVEDAKFVVSVTPDGEAPESVSVEGKLYVLLDQLVAKTQHEIKVGYVRDNKNTDWSDSASITTVDDDFKPPMILSNVNGVRDDPNTVMYNTTWEFSASQSGAAGLQEFEVLRCTSACDVEPVDKAMNSSRKALPYYTDYAVWVLAVLENEGTVTKRASAESIFKTVPGRPGEVENIEISQEADTLDLEITWSPPNQPNGNIVAYGLTISTGDNTLIDLKSQTLNFTQKIEKSADVADQYNITVYAIDDVNDAKSQEGAKTTELYDLQKPAPPTDLKLIDSRTDSIEVQIIRESNKTVVFDVTVDSKQTQTTNSTDLRFDGFETYTRVPVSVKTCIALADDENVTVCGLPRAEKFWTNVAAPSAVVNLTSTKKNDRLEMTWEEPEKQEGPINGYIVRISDKTNEKNKEVDVENASRNFTFNGLENCVKYEFAVFAYNNDVLTNAKVNGTISVSNLTTENCTSKAFPAWAIVLIVLVLLGAGGGGAYYYLKVRRQS